MLTFSAARWEWGEIIGARWLWGSQAPVSRPGGSALHTKIIRIAAGFRTPPFECEDEAYGDDALGDASASIDHPVHRRLIARTAL
jgi:hypothetical protein